MNFLSQLTRSMLLESNVHISNTDLIDLSTIKSPYPPSPKVGEVLNNLDLNTLNNNVDYDAGNLRQTIANKLNLKLDNVFIQKSCDVILSLCYRAFFDSKDMVAIPDITSTFYKKCAKVNNVSYEIISVTQDMKIHLSDLAESKCKGVILNNPNSPTGYTVNKLDLINLINDNPDKLFIIDERFVEYSNTSIANILPQAQNLIILRSFAYAYGLAGIRCAYALACEELIKALDLINRAISRYAIDKVTQVAAEACIGDDAYLRETIDKVISTREDFSDKLRSLNFEVLPSNANFIFCKHEDMNASEIQFLLREEGIKVKQYKNKKIENYLRITIGTPEEMDLILKKIKKFLKNANKQ